MVSVSKVGHRTYATMEGQAPTITGDAMIFLVQPVHRLYNVDPNLGMQRVRCDPINGQGGRPFLHSNGVRMVQQNTPRSKRNALSFEHVAQKFLIPIKVAAKEFNVSRSTLEFRCRELGIPKWPYRKLKSLENLIETVVEFAHPGFQDVVCKVRQEIEEIKLNPSQEIKEETEHLRREMFDLKYKQRRIDGRVVE